MKLKDQLESQYQGLPGLGVNGKEGEEGRKGRSIYIGHVKDFFDNRLPLEAEYSWDDDVLGIRVDFFG